MIEVLNKTNGNEVKTIQPASAFSTSKINGTRQKIEGGPARCQILGKLQAALRGILADYDWSQYDWTKEEMLDDSPVDLKNNLDQHWRLFLGIFRPDDVIWTGDSKNSTDCNNQEEFQRIDNLLKRDHVPGSFVATFSLNADSYSHCKDSGFDRRFIMVQAAAHRLDDGPALIRFLEEVCDLSLAAIVNNGTNEYWGWFYYPGDEVVSEISRFFVCDEYATKLFSPDSVYPMPGSPSIAGKTHQLVWLNDSNPLEVEEECSQVNPTTK
jgi:hypothetical protein